MGPGDDKFSLKELWIDLQSGEDLITHADISSIVAERRSLGYNFNSVRIDVRGEFWGVF